MKRNKSMILFILVFSLICFGGCKTNQTQEKTPGEIDITLLYEELSAALDLTNEIEQIDASMVNTLYGLQPGDIAHSLVYMSTGAKSDEIAIFQCADAEVAQRLKTSFKERQEDEINIFKDYAPEEVTKLKAAIIFTNGSYALYCVSSDSKEAERIINSYF